MSIVRSSLESHERPPHTSPRSAEHCGALALHGLGGTPNDVRPVVEALAADGLAVRSPLLAGHRDIKALEQSHWRDWYASASEAFDELRNGGRRKVLVFGFSMGALLALRLAALRGPDVQALVVGSVPLRFDPWQRAGISALARLRRSKLTANLVGVLPKASGPDLRVRREREASPGLPGFPYPTLEQMLALQREVDELLPHVRTPTLLVHGRLDHTASPHHSRTVAQRIAASHVELVILPRSFHIIGLDLDRDRLCSEVVRFSRSFLIDDNPPDLPPGPS